MAGDWLVGKEVKLETEVAADERAVADRVPARGIVAAWTRPAGRDRDPWGDALGSFRVSGHPRRGRPSSPDMRRMSLVAGRWRPDDARRAVHGAICIPECRADAPKRCQMSSVQLPVTVLTVLGILIAVLGLFAAGSLAMAVVGLAAVAFAGVLAVVGTRRT